jgi:hypothetical protein
MQQDGSKGDDVRGFIIVTTLVCALAAACGDDDGPAPAATSAPPTAAASPSSGPAGSPTSETPGAFIEIDEPADGASVSVPFTARGSANVFEAALTVQVVDDSGAVVCERSVQATSGSGTPGTWEAEVAFVPPASETEMTLRAFSLSARDGSEENVVQHAIRVSAEEPNIIITSPECGQHVQALTTLTVEGIATAFEATLTVEMRDMSGDVVRSEVVTADNAERGNWQTTFDLTGLNTAQYEIVAYSLSAEDGSVQDVFSIPVRITT